MKRKKLREFAEGCVRQLTTSSFTTEEDVRFLSLVGEIEENLIKFNEFVSRLVERYEIILENNQPKEGFGEYEKFNEAFKIYFDEEIEIKTKLKFETIQKIKNENNLPIFFFKFMVDNLKES